MSCIAIGFYGEGRRDYGFLLPVVERVLQVLLPHLDVLMISLEHIDMSGLSQEQKIERIAEETYGYGITVFHLDADAPNTKQAYTERFNPGYLQVMARRQSGENVNIDIVPVIPVRMTEAWMLIDFEAFRQVTKTRLSADRLGFVQNPHQVEAIQDPETRFIEAVRNSQPGRRRPMHLERIYVPLAARVRLGELDKVPAYKEFLGRLTQILRDLNYIS